MKNKIQKLGGFAIVAVILVGLATAIMNKEDRKLTYTELIQAIETSRITDIEIQGDGETAYVQLKEDLAQEETIQKEVHIPNLESFMEYITEYLKPQEGKVINLDKNPENILITILTLIAPFGIIIITVLFFIITMSSGSQNGKSKSATFGKSKAKMMTPADKNKITFADVAGVDEEKEELEEIVEFLKNPAKFTNMGARIPKGVLLVGQPGTGKTLLAKAVAGEAGVPFFIISGSDFVEMFVGVGASRVRDLFEQAKRNSPCIIFIDEIDAVGRQRGAGLGGGHDEREQTLNQLLVEMDGFSPNEGVIVMAATNRPDILDKALLRAGRFDRQIVVSAPDVLAREQILEVHARKKRISEEVDLKTIARNTAGFVGADLENILNEAA